MIKSQIYKKTIYPEDFTEEDKATYDKLKAEALFIHPDVEDFIIHISVISHIRLMKGEQEPFKDEEIEELKRKYVNKYTEVKFNPEDYPDLYDKTKNPIYFNEEQLDEYFKMQRLNSNLILEDNKDESNTL